MKADDLLVRDRRAVWHPYTASPPAGPIFAAKRAEGVRIWLEDGRELIDGMSSWWSAIHGYGHPVLVEALERQAREMAHVMFGGLTHEPAVSLAERLVSLTPAPLERVFLCDSGSVSVEVAIKMALQYWHGRGRPQKRKLLAPRGGYHGDTFGAMAVCDPVNGMHTLFQGVLPQHEFVGRPSPAYDDAWDEGHIAELRGRLEQRGPEIAAVILEPIVQGAGGMWMYSPRYLSRVRELCDEHEVLLILDEIATGFGRTGRLFGCEHAGMSPDIMCLGKALTGGMMTAAATLTTAEVADGIRASEPGVFMHGPTFMGNPLAAAVAGASIDLLMRSDWQAKVSAIEAQLSRELSPCRELPGVRDVRVLGAIGVVELEEPVDMNVVQPAFVDRGVWIRPFGRLVYTMPPFVIEPEDLSRITSAIREVIATCGGS
jgi:adenosylmethionine---8-amino-7-oxononanoate aminotransferase